MEKVEICKLTIGNETYRVNELVKNDVEQKGFRVMRGRRIAKGGSWFNSKRVAIQFMLSIAFEDVSRGVIVLEL